MSTSANSRPRTSAARSPPSSISSTIARSRWVPRSARNACTSASSRTPAAADARAPAGPPAARPARAEMPEQTRRARSPLTASRRRHRIGRHHAGDHRDTRTSPAPRRPAGSPSPAQRPAARPAGPPSTPAVALGWLLPVQIVEQVRRHHIGQTSHAARQEPQEVQQVIRVRADASPGRSSCPSNVPETRSPSRHRRAARWRHHRRARRPRRRLLPEAHRHLQAESHRPPVSVPTCLAGGTSHAPARRPVTRAG